MAAYCHLLGVSEGARSPYGVIIKGETFAAVTVPNTPRTQAMFREALVAARRAVRESEEVNSNPPPPENANLCHECPYRLACSATSQRTVLRHGAPIEPKVAKDPRGNEYHSHCGDRFRWIPPHRDAIAMESVGRISSRMSECRCDTGGRQTSR